MCYQARTRPLVITSPPYPSAPSSIHPTYPGLPGADTFLGHYCTPSLLVSLGSLLLDCAREPPESKGERYKKCMLRSSIPSCFARCLLSLLDITSRYSIGLFPTSYGIGEHGEQNKETCYSGYDAREEVCGARPDRIHEQAAQGISQGLSGAVAQKPDGEYASQEGFRHPFLQDGVGRNVVDAGSGAFDS